MAFRKKTLAMEVAEAFSEDIIQNKYDPRRVLPSEPELEEKYSVSRGVIRDALRIVMAWGLIEIQHGRGAFIVEDPSKTLKDAILLTIRRTAAGDFEIYELTATLLEKLMTVEKYTGNSHWLTETEELYKSYLGDKKKGFYFNEEKNLRLLLDKLFQGISSPASSMMLKALFNIIREKESEDRQSSGIFDDLLAAMILSYRELSESSKSQSIIHVIEKLKSLE